MEIQICKPKPLLKVFLSCFLSPEEVQVRKSYDCLHMHLHVTITIILHLQYATLDIQGLLLNKVSY